VFISLAEQGRGNNFEIDTKCSSVDSTAQTNARFELLVMNVLLESLCSFYWQMEAGKWGFLVLLCFSGEQNSGGKKADLEPERRRREGQSRHYH
jgi:hypothetical protein